MKSLSILAVITAASMWGCKPGNTHDGHNNSNTGNILVKKTADFNITGKGINHNWNRTGWNIIPRIGDTGNEEETKMKILYSNTGLYFLFSCADKLITATMNSDFMDLWNEDVVEVFLWPDTNDTLYFEYELSPLNYELPILVSNSAHDLTRWQPFHYEADRKTSHRVDIVKDPQNDSLVTGWNAEFFIPYKLLRPLNDIHHASKTKWRANFYWLDYDSKEPAAWSWKKTQGDFHDVKSFGIIEFE